MAVFDDSQPAWEDKLLLYRHAIDRSCPVPNPVKADAERVAVNRAEPLKGECRHFAQSVESRTRPRTDGREGLAVLRVLDAAERALAANLDPTVATGDAA